MKNPKIVIELNVKTGHVTTTGPANLPVLMLRMLSGALTQVAEEVVRPMSPTEASHEDEPSRIIQPNPSGIVKA